MGVIKSLKTRNWIDEMNVAKIKAALMK